MKNAALILIGAIVLVVFSCSNEGDGFLARLLRRGGDGVPVTVESVSVEERSQETRLPATVEASEAIDVTLPEDAVVEAILVAEGNRVAVGDPLVRLSEADLTARLAKLRADAKEAQVTLEKNTYFLNNRDRLLAEGKIDQTQYDTLESEIGRDEAALEKLRLEVGKAEDRTGSPIVTSPIAGTIAKIGSAPGLTTPAGRPLLSVAKSDQAAIAFRIPSSPPPSLREGETVKVALSTAKGTQATARIISLAATEDGTALAVKAQFVSTGNRPKPGTSAEVVIPSAHRTRVFVVPEEALIRERGAVFVFTVDKKVARRVQVIPNETSGNRVEILRGINEDDLVVVRGHEKLDDGTVVDIWKK